MFVTSTNAGSLIGGPYDLGHGGPGGWWILGEPELHLGGDVLVPDMAGWRRTRMTRLPDVYRTRLGLGVRDALALDGVA